jgi:plasmid stabilization system protein ParE
LRLGDLVGTGQSRSAIYSSVYRPRFKAYAKKVIQDLVAKTDVLDELPRIGRVVPELGREEIRELL